MGFAMADALEKNSFRSLQINETLHRISSYLLVPAMHTCELVQDYLVVDLAQYSSSPRVYPCLHSGSVHSDSACVTYS